MKSPADQILAEVGSVEQIVRVACRVEGARRGGPVSPHDPKVQTLAADMILSGLGAVLRSVVEQMDQPPLPSSGGLGIRK